MGEDGSAFGIILTDQVTLQFMLDVSEQSPFDDSRTTSETGFKNRRHVEAEKEEKGAVVGISAPVPSNQCIDCSNIHT